ncbi:MAG: AMP-binding protein [Lachnospiraceae bacterium]|nr:AMP-binding protein [Lachnospiraceae bacterium]
MSLIHELIKDYAKAFPAKAAVTDIYGELSYRELEAQSASISAALTELGIECGDAVAVYVPYVKEILLGAVSVFRAGGVFIPFDETYPVERLEYMLKDSSAKAILTFRNLWEQKGLDFPKDKVIFMDEKRDLNVENAHAKGLTEDSPAMLLYTSGTTGQPKGVLHSHKMLLHLVDWIKIHEDADMSADTRSGVMSSFSFIGTQMFLLGPLTKGGRVSIAPEDARKDLGKLDRFLRESQITHIFLPSGLAAIFAEDYETDGIFIFAAGERLRNFRMLSPGNFLINSYGSTETSGVLSKKVYGDEEKISVGRHYSNTEALIVNDRMLPLPPGEAGELLLFSDFMAKGYWKLSDINSQKWINLDGRTWFRTGDRAQCTSEGEYELLGRIDNMVKLRGFRIETGEVEAQIANALIRLGRDDVKQTVVVIKNVNGADHLTCYYEAKNDLDKGVVIEEISKKLTEYMIPDLWVRMDQLPRNANGKVLRRELPQPKRDRGSYGILDSEIIARVLFAAEDVLKTEGYISPDDRFTDLGGTSLTAMQFASVLREQGIKINGGEILKLNVLRRIAEAADVAYEQLWTRQEYEAVKKDFAARGEHIQKVLPLSSEQDEMLFMQLLYPDLSRQRDIWILQLDSCVLKEDLREALDIIARENEALRSSIVFRNVSAIQQVITDRKIPLEITEVDSFGSREMEEMRKELLYEPMDIQLNSLIKVISIQDQKRNFLGIMSDTGILGMTNVRHSLLRFMEVLGEKYPKDISIMSWRDLLELGASLEAKGKQEHKSKRKAVSIRKDTPEDIYVYSENQGPKLVFVHTGNTGSEAYYQLADRIREYVSFAVIEPFNLYHPKEAVYGIKEIAANYIRILKQYQPSGPYMLGGWCYGGVVAHEMACQLEQSGEEVIHLFMLDSHAISNNKLRKISKGMSEQVNREYFETCPLFAEIREKGMLDAMVKNAGHVAEDMVHHKPSFYHGDLTYFRPELIPAGISGDNLKYWEKIMEFEAGNYENYCSREKLRIVSTPHEHDLMMDDPSLDVIVPVILETVNIIKN